MPPTLRSGPHGPPSLTPGYSDQERGSATRDLRSIGLERASSAIPKPSEDPRERSGASDGVPSVLKHVPESPEGVSELVAWFRSALDASGSLADLVGGPEEASRTLAHEARATEGAFGNVPRLPVVAPPSSSSPPASTHRRPQRAGVGAVRRRLPPSCTSRSGAAQQAAGTGAPRKAR